MKRFLKQNPRFLCHAALASIWLLFLAATNRYSNIPITSIFPFMFPVVLIAWTYGTGWGFAYAALATLAAMPGGYMQHHDMHDLYWAAFTTYLKLTAAATGIIIGKNIARRREGQ